MSILSTLPIHILSNSLALNHILRNCGKRPDWELWTYASFLRHDPTRPGHVYEKRWELFQNHHIYPETSSVNLLDALRCVGDEYLELRNGRLFVKNDSAEEQEISPHAPGKSSERRPGDTPTIFGRWQNIRARMSTLPIKLFILHKAGRPVEFFLAHPHSSNAADFIRNEGLNETHLHLNAYQYPEESWLEDLYNIDSFLARETEDFKKSDIRKLYIGINPTLTPIIMANRMKLAKLLRESIIKLSRSPFDEQYIENILHEANYNLSIFALSPSFYTTKGGYAFPPLSLNMRMKQEMEMWENAFTIMENDKFSHKIELQHILHLYLLIQNEHIQLNRHNEFRKGFDAFSETSDHKRRNIGTKAYYEETFLRILKAAHAHDWNCIEVRLTPGGIIRKKNILLEAYQTACRTWKDDRKRTNAQNGVVQNHPEGYPKLILVAHFIKTRLSVKSAGGCRIPAPLYDNERRLYIRQASQLAGEIHKLVEHKRIPIGIDAANSEMKLPPEVFAPAYRFFEKTTNIAHKTYHCGEDFLHLLDGIRAVYEAVIFLRLKDGNRIGHGTALGIHPSLWLESMPAKLLLPRREWLMDLIFAWRLLHGTDAHTASTLEQEALRVADLIFGETDLTHHSIYILNALFEARHMDPNCVYQKLHQLFPVSSRQRIEHDAIARFEQKYGRSALELYWRWNIHAECRQKQEELEEIRTNYLPSEILLKLQQQVQHLLSRRDVVIETLPVSNLRISQYKNIQQHHILRWLKAGPHKQEGDADMQICIGSDDPGIFVTDIRNEYYHLYTMLRTAGLSAAESLAKLRQVNAAGRIYAFTDIPEHAETHRSLRARLRKLPRRSLFKRQPHEHTPFTHQ